MVIVIDKAKVFGAFPLGDGLAGDHFKPTRLAIVVPRR